jgi:diacylglycerol O-acyltransferase / wax synthase
MALVPQLGRQVPPGAEPSPRGERRCSYAIRRSRTSGRVRRLELIAAETSERKKKSRPPAGSMFRTVLLQRAFLRLMPRQRCMNTYVANVPGPPIPLYFAGERLLEFFPIVPITANVSIGVGTLSYAGQFNLTAVADRDLCPDLGVFVAGVQHSLEALERSVALTGSRSGRRRSLTY